MAFIRDMSDIVWDIHFYQVLKCVEDQISLQPCSSLIVAGVLDRTKTKDFQPAVVHLQGQETTIQVREGGSKPLRITC